MSLKIGTNIASMVAQRRIGEASAKVSQSLERLGSGLRINNASDDAAGLAIALSLQGSARIYTQGIRNFNDGLSYLAIADGALQQMIDITTRQKELAEQAANGSLSLTQRRALNKEANELVKEFNRIVSSTNFNNLSIFNQPAGLSNLVLQGGTGTSGTLSFLIGEGSTRAIGNGTFAAPTTYAVGSGSEEIRNQEFADINGDGFLDIVSSVDDSQTIAVQFGNGDGTFQAAISSEILNYSELADIELGDFNGDGRIDAVIGSQIGGVYLHLGNGDGTFSDGSDLGIAASGSGDVEVGDINGDGKLDVLGEGEYRLGNGNGTFSSVRTLTGAGARNIMADINSDGVLDVVSHAGTSIKIFLGSGSGTFSLAGSISGVSGVPSFDGFGVADINGDGALDVTARTGASTLGYWTGNGDGTFQTGGSINPGFQVGFTLFNDMNGDGFQDIVVQSSFSNAFGIAYGNGSGSFSAVQSFSKPGGLSFTTADVNGDGAADVITGDLANTLVSLSNTNDSNTIAALDILSQANARNALTLLAEQQRRLADERGRIGAYQSRVSVAVNNLQAARDRFVEAGSRITDVDVASESAELLRATILQQAATAIAGQANESPALVLTLLR